MKTNNLTFIFVFLLTIAHLKAQKPNISNFSPTSGVVGTTVTITGTNFNATTTQNVVFFGATKATISAASTTSLTVTVPTGATFQPITVLNLSNVLSGSSSAPFRVTYPGGSIIVESLAEESVDFTTGTLALFLAIGDLDGDGKTDMVTANFNAGTISVFRNTATSGTIDATSFAAKVDFTTGGGPFSLAIGDLDGDGKPDVAVTNETDNTVRVIQNSYISVPTNITGPATICANNTATLSATCVAGTTPTWWEAIYFISPGGPPPSPLFVGSPFITPPLTFKIA